MRVAENCINLRKTLTSHFLPNVRKVTKHTETRPDISLSLSNSFSLYFCGRERGRRRKRRETTAMDQSSPRAYLPSPNSHSSNSSSSSNTPVTRSEPNNPYLTTYVQADSTSFKQVVQMLTGSSETVNKQAHKSADPGRNPNPNQTPIPPMKSGARKQQQQGFKLFERRNSMKNGFKISPLSSSGIQRNPNPYGVSPRKSEILSPSMLDFPSLVLSPVTPLLTDPFNRGPNNLIGSGLSLGSGLDGRAEEKAIAEKGFYLQSEPKLLPLFPMTSPKFSGSSSSS